MKNILVILTAFIGIFIFNGCGDEGVVSETSPQAARMLDGRTDMRDAYILTRTAIKYHKPMYDAFDGEDGHRLAIFAIQTPNKPQGHIFVRVSVIPENAGHNTVYSNRPVRVGYPGHVHITNYQNRFSAGPLKRDTFDCYIHYTDSYGILSFNAYSRIGKNAYIDLDVGGRTYKVALIDS